MPRPAEQAHPFYKPLWRRVVIVAAVAAWFAYESLYTGHGMWIVIAGGMLAYSVWLFFITFPKEGEEKK